MKIIFNLIRLLSVLFVFGCSQKASEPVQLNSHSEPQKTWQKQQLKNYQYQIQYHCYCLADFLRPMKVVVKNNQIDSAFFIDTNNPVPKALAKDLKTIDQWFDFINKAKEKNYFRLEVNYNDALGYPTSLDSDYQKQLADDELKIQITQFKSRQ